MALLGIDDFPVAMWYCCSFVDVDICIIINKVCSVNCLDWCTGILLPMFLQALDW